MIFPQCSTFNDLLVRQQLLTIAYALKEYVVISFAIHPYIIFIVINEGYLPPY